MTRRFLPPEEWHRLDSTEQLRDVWPMLRATHDRVLVVEDDAGRIVGTWAFMAVIHGEGLWIDPSHRGGSAVARHLLRGLREVGTETGVAAVWTGSVDEQVDRLCRHFGASEVPMKSWVIPMTRGES